MLFFLNKALPDCFLMPKRGTCSLPSSQPSQSQQQDHLTSQEHKTLEYWGGSLIMDLSRGLCSAARKNDPLNLESPEQHFSAHHSKKSSAKAANQRCLLRRNISVYDGFESYAIAEVLWRNLVFCLLRRKCEAPDEDTNVSEGVVRWDDVPWKDN